MSMVNLCDLLGAFISGHLQSHVRANFIGLGCAVLIIGAFVLAFFGIWYDRRHNTDRTGTNAQGKSMDRIVLKNCWPIRQFTKYHRGSFKVIV